MLRTRNFLVLLVVILCLDYANAQCPPENLIRPCKCEGFLPIVECGDITEMEVLVDVFKRSGDRKFNMFALYNSTLMYLPATAISTKEFEHIILYNVSMTALFNDLPYDGNKINIISLHKVQFQRGVGWELFGPMKKLELFEAESTEIKTLGKSFTDNINKDLTNLILTNTKTKKIQLNAFAKLKKLFDLEIINSNIKAIKRSMFSTPSALEKIIFSGNKIESLPDDIFTNMPELKEVILDNNKLTTIAQGAFESVFDRSGYIDLTGNPLKCDCKILWFVIKNNKHISGRCAAPPDQEGKNVEDLTKKDLDYC